MEVQTQTEEVRRLRRTNLELIFSRPQRLLPAALPEQVPEPHRHPGLPQGQRRGQLPRVDPDLQADDPVPERPRPGLPGAVRGALPARRGRRGDRDPRLAPLRRRPGHQVDARRRRRPADPVRGPAEDRPAGRRHRVRAGRHGRGLLPADRRPRRHGLRARPGAGRDAPLRHPAVPPAEGRGPRGRVRVGRPGSAARWSATPGSGATSRSTTSRTRASTRSSSRSAATTRTSSACRRGRRRGPRRPRVPPDRDARPAVPGPRGQARRRHRRRLHLDGLLADVDPPGRGRGDARLPPRHEGHAGGERGPRGDRGRRHGDLPGRPDARRHGRRRARSPASSSSGCSPASPTRPAGAARSRRPARSSRSPATGSCWRSARAPSSTGSGPARTGPQATKQPPPEGRRGHVRDRPARRVRHRRRPDRRRDGRPGGRRGPARGLRRRAFLQGPRPRGDQDPPAARRAAAGVPLDRAVHERAEGAALPAQGDGGRGPQRAATSSTRSRTPARRPSPSRRAASSAPARRSASATCAASGSSTARRSRRSSRSTTRAPATGA